MRNAQGKSPLDNLGMFKDDAEQKVCCDTSLVLQLIVHKLYVNHMSDVSEIAQALGWEMANVCAITKEPFGMFSRRHHCRFCLRSVSDGASKQKLFGHRICDTCIGDGLTEERYQVRLCCPRQR
eukprot:SAG31_NODE_449_length_15539_cov_21.936658_4_plen_124_part_00